MRKTEGTPKLHRLLFCGAVMSALANPASAGIIYDAASGFLSTNNPGQIWNYGSSAGVGGMVTLFDTFTDTFADLPGEPAWYGNDSVGFAGPDTGFPVVIKNGTGGTITARNVGNWLTSQLLLHPDSQDDFAVVQFTVPVTAVYTITGAFVGIDNGIGTSTDVDVIANGTNVFAGNVTGFGVSQPFFVTSQLTAGATVDFEVGWGPPHNFFYGDSTGLSVTITATPEPALEGLITLALGVMAFVRRQSKK